MNSSTYQWWPNMAAPTLIKRTTVVKEIKDESGNVLSTETTTVEEYEKPHAAAAPVDPYRPFIWYSGQMTKFNPRTYTINN